jgi:hypothetical protein
MSYSTDNLICNGGPPNGQQEWSYKSADSVATVIAADYFSDGSARGMRVGDFVKIYDTNVGDGAVAFVTAVTAGGAASAAEYQAVTT